MAGLPIYSNVSRWVFSGGHNAAPEEPEYGYMNYIQDWSSSYMRPQPLPPFSQYKRVGGYFSAPFTYSDEYPGYTHLSAYYPKAMIYTGRDPRTPYDRIYDQPINTRERELQRHKPKRKPGMTNHVACFRHGRGKKKYKSKSNKKIQMLYRNWNPHEPQKMRESTYPMYMIPKRRVSYQNYMQESSFYGDDDDMTLESGSQSYHHWQHDPGLYRMRQGDMSSTSSHTSYQNHGAGSDIEEEVIDTVVGEELEQEADDREKIGDETSRQIYENTQEAGSFEEGEASKKNNYENIPAFTDYDKDFSRQNYENTQTFRYSDTEISKKNYFENTETFRYSDTETSRKNSNANFQMFKFADTKDPRNQFYENAWASKISDTQISRDNVYENTQIPRVEALPKKNIYEDIQTPTDQETGTFWKDRYEDPKTSAKFNEEIKRSKYEYIETSTNTDYMNNSDLIETVNRKEYSELQTVSQDAAREFDGHCEDKQYLTPGYMGHEVTQTLDSFKDSYINENNTNVGCMQI